MKRYKFKTDNDVKDFLEEMIADGLVFHLDDDPEDIMWQSAQTDPAFFCKLMTLKLNMIDLWKYCDPWLVMSKFPEVEHAYMNYPSN